MEQTNSNFLGKHKQFRINRKKFAAAFIAFALIVTLIVFWWLKLIGITATGEAFCGINEHTHSDDCYISEIICGFEETVSGTLPNEEQTSLADESEATEENTTEETTEEAEETTTAAETHIHTEDCYKKTLSCTKTEHTHSQECFPDKTADVETVSDWLDTIKDVEITNNIPENLIAIAMSQIGYEESRNNFEFDADGNKNGYTRYGEWYGNPYGKWNAMFVSFCLHYSNINNESELKASGSEALRLAWQNRGIYSQAEGYEPESGDVVFFDNNSDAVADTAGIVFSATETTLVVIIGDSNDKVEKKYIENSDNIMGYGMTGELSFAKDMEYEEKSSEPITEPEETTEFTPPPLMMFSTPRANITYVNDLTSVVKSVTFKTLDGVEINNNSTVYIGQTYVISVEFAEDNTGDEWIQFQHDEDHRLYYQIPENIHCEPFTEWHPITATTENGTVEDVGEYFIGEDGMLIVVFHDDPETNECFGAKYSNVNFAIDFNATIGSTQSGTSTEVVFNEEIKVNLNIDSKAEMNVTKTAKAYDGKNNTKEYTIRIEGTKAVIKDLIVYDDMYTNSEVDNHQHALKDTIVVTDLEGNVLDPQPTISDGRYTGNLGFTLTDFPDFAAGEGYIITYLAAINDDVLDQESVALWNGVYPEGKDAMGNKVEGKAEYWERVYLNKIVKDGKQAMLKGPDNNPVPVIEWEVEIRKSDYNLEGTVLIDTLGEGLEYYTGEDILIECYDQYGNGPIERTLSWDNVTIEGDSMSFPLPEGYRFVITYYTTYEELQDGEQKHYTNQAKVTINNKEEVAGGDADVVGFIPQIKKSASGDDGKYVYFNIEAEVPAVIKNWGSFFLTDLAAVWGYSTGSLYIENVPEDLVITAKTESGREVTFTPYVPGGPVENTYILVTPAAGNQYHSFNIYFNTSIADANLSTWMLNEDATLTVSYKIPFDAKTGTEWTGEPTGDKILEDVLLEKYRLSNEAYLNYTDVITATATSSYLYTPKITKKAETNEDGTIDYTVTFYNTIPGSQGPLGYLTSTSSIVFNDTFNEKLEYVPGSLSVTCYSPWNDSVWFSQYHCNEAADNRITGNTISMESTDFNVRTINPDVDENTYNWMIWISNYQQHCNEVAGGRHVFTYKLKLKDEYLNTTEENKYVLDNTAELTWDNDGTSGPVTDEVEFKTGLLDKHAVQENNKLKFDIHVNRNALDILEGADTLTIEDTMTDNLSVYWDSIKLYYEDGKDNWIDFSSAGSKHTFTVTYDPTSNKLTFVIPDSLHVRIDYTTLITASGLVSVSNAVKVEGKAQVSDILDATFKVEDHSGGASGSLNNITLLKQDGDTDIALPNVRFLLYGPMGDPNATVPAGAQASIVTDTGKNLYYIGSYTTGVDGTVKIETQYLTIGGPYALVEDFPPIGYNILEEPVYFYFYEPDPNGIIQTVTTLIAIENYTYGFVLPETGGTGTLPFTIFGFALMATPILYSILRRKRERRFN